MCHVMMNCGAQCHTRTFTNDQSTARCVLQGSQMTGFLLLQPTSLKPGLPPLTMMARQNSRPGPLGSVALEKNKPNFAQGFTLVAHTDTHKQRAPIKVSIAVSMNLYNFSQYDIILLYFMIISLALYLFTILHFSFGGEENFWEGILLFQVFVEIYVSTWDFFL